MEAESRLISNQRIACLFFGPASQNFPKCRELLLWRTETISMMKRLLFACATLVFSTVCSAASICTTATLAIYDSPGFSCSLGPLTFGSFQFSTVGTIAPLPVDGAVLVTPINDATSQGLSFQGPFGASAGLQLDVAIAFVITSNPPVIDGDTLAIQGFGVSGGGSVQVTESMCVGAVPVSNGGCGGSGGTKSLDVFADSGGIKALDSVTFSPVSILAVSKDIMVHGGAPGTSSSAGVSLVINTVPGGGTTRSVVPEPSSVLLFFAGFGVMLLRRRQRRSGNA